MTTTTRTDSNGQPRKTLASQLDRLDGILDGLEEALAGAVQDAVATAVKEAVRAVLSEVLTNQTLQQQLEHVAPNDPPPEQPSGPKGSLRRLWDSTTRRLRRTACAVKEAGGRLGSRVWLTLLAVGGVIASAAYAARRRIASAAATVYQAGKRLMHRAGAALVRLLPVFALGGT